MDREETRPERGRSIPGIKSSGPISGYEKEQISPGLSASWNMITNSGKAECGILVKMTEREFAKFKRDSEYMMKLSVQNIEGISVSVTYNASLGGGCARFSYSNYSEKDNARVVGILVGGWKQIKHDQKMLAFYRRETEKGGGDPAPKSIP